MRAADCWLPGALLLLLAGGDYGAPVLAALSGWPMDWCDYMLQGARTAGLWALVVALVPRSLVLPPGAAVCVWGAWEALQRPACAVAQMLHPVPLRPDDTRSLCELHSGVDLYALGIAAIAVLAVLVAAWATADDKQR